MKKQKKKLCIYQVDYKYIKYLRTFDKKVTENKIDTNNKRRPYIGILITIDNINFIAPLSSPKIYRDKIDNNDSSIITKFQILDINNENYDLGIVNLSYMIPIKLENCELYNIEKYGDKYKRLITKQHTYIKSNQDLLLEKAKKLYKSKDNNIKSKCCDFDLLIEKCKEYNS